jgi:hypothetical protein
MRQISFLFIALCLGISNSLAQQAKAEYSISLTKINVIVLDLSGNTSIKSSDNDEVKIKSFLMTDGHVLGWKFPNERPSFQISERVSNDTIYISTPIIFNPKSIGIDTYSETIVNTIQLAPDKIIDVRSADQLTVEDDLRQLKTTNTNSLIVDVHKSSVNELICHAKAIIKINGTESLKEYELNGNGSNTYNLQAAQITINFK